MVLTEVTFAVAIAQVSQQMTAVYLKLKIGNPLWRAIYAYFGVNLSFTSTERTIDDNCRRVRTKVNDYV